MSWEGSAPARRPPVLLVLVVLGVVVVAGLLARPPGTPGREGADDQLEVRSGQDVPDTAPEPERPVLIHALNTASLEPRVPPLEVDLTGWGRLRTATTERGRPLLLLGLESADGAVAELRVLDAATLQPVADLGRHPGPLEHLGVSEDGRAAAWLQPPGGSGGQPVVHRVPIDGSAPTRFALPAGFEVREMRALRERRLAVAGTRAPATPGMPLSVLTHQVGQGTVEEVVLDVGEHVPDSAGTPLEGVRAALEWNTLRQLLHVVHAAEDRMTTVRLTDGAVVTSPEAGSVRTLVRRRAVLAVDGDAVVVTGDAVRASDLDDPGRGMFLPLEPLRFAADSPTLSFQAGTPAELSARGAARAGEVIAAARDRSILAARTRLDDGRRGVVLQVLDDRLEQVAAPIELAGDVVAARLDVTGSRLRIATATEEGTQVRILDVADGRILAEEVYARYAEAHLGAAVVIERP